VISTIQQITPTLEPAFRRNEVLDYSTGLSLPDFSDSPALQIAQLTTPYFLHYIEGIGNDELILSALFFPHPSPCREDEITEPIKEE